jgi:hypothetical protein
MVDRHGSREGSPGRNRGTVIGGAVLGMFAWFFIAFVATMATYGSESGSTSGWLLWGFVAIFACAVGLIAWPRTRRLGEGLLLGVAIGLVVAGGLCIPMIVSAS